MKKRVCIFSAQYLPSSGGVEKYTFHIAQKLSERNVEVTIVTSDLYGADVYEKNGQSRIYRLPSAGLMGNRLPVVLYNVRCRRMLKEIFKKRYDLVITNTRLYPLSLLGVLYGKKYANANIVIEHGSSHIALSSAFWSSIGQAYEHILAYLLKKNAGKFYGVSKACNEWLGHFGIRSSGILHNAIDLEQIEKQRLSQASMKERLGIAKEDIVISFTGRILKEKGVFQLARAFSAIHREYGNVNLVIAGDGPMMPELKKACAKSGANIYLLGQVTFPDVLALLWDSNIFCFPSAYPEGMPTSVLEAAACGNCIIMTDCGGAKEIIPDGSYGIIIPDNKEETIAAALRNAVNDREYRERAARNVYQRVREYFVWDKVVDGIGKMV